MKKKLEIPESVTKALKAVFDNKEEQRKYSTADICRRETILQNLKKMMNPSDAETAIITDLAVQIETAKVKSAELEKQEPVLADGFRKEFSKWLRGKYLYNHRHLYYICVRKVEFRPGNQRELYIEGPTVSEERALRDMTAFECGDKEYNILPLYAMSSWSYQNEFEQIMSGFEECEPSDIKDALDSKKKEWDEYHDNMKALVDEFSNIKSCSTDNEKK